MKILTGFAVVKDTVGNRISYTYTPVDAEGNILDNNKKESFVVLDEETKALVEQLENKIKERF